MPNSNAEYHQTTSPNESASTDDRDTIVFEDVAVGYVAKDGSIRLINGDREVGHVANDRDNAIAVLRDRYQQYVEQTRQWCEESRTEENRLWRIADCDRRVNEIDQQYVLGTFDEIRTLLADLKTDLLREQQERIAQRNEMIGEAKKLASRTDWKDAGQAFDELNESFKSVGTVGDRDQDTRQWDTFKEHERTFRAKRKAHFDEMEKEFASRAEAKSRLCDEAESLMESSDFRETGARLREMMDSWKEIGFAGREHDDALWQRFQQARTAFYDRRKDWFAENAIKKEELATKAEALAALEDSASAQLQMKPLMQQWREIGSAGKNADDALWSRFRGAQEDVYQRSREVFDERQKEREQNFQQKQALVAEAEGLIGTDTRTATARCKELQQEWKKIGPVPRDQNERQWQRFRAACDSVFRIANAEGKRRIEDARDHAEDQIRKLSGEIDEHERKITHWEGVIANLRDGDGADEIRESMEAKIATARERIEIKLGWIEEQHARMGELSRKL